MSIFASLSAQGLGAWSSFQTPERVERFIADPFFIVLEKLEK